MITWRLNNNAKVAILRDSETRQGLYLSEPDTVLFLGEFDGADDKQGVLREWFERYARRG